MTLATLLLRVIGAPDYQVYVEHMRICHPDSVLLSEEEFFRQRLNDRYNRAGSRCC
jgi:uncharacterized short protein YbdD (DUF466 family)